MPATNDRQRGVLGASLLTRRTCLRTCAGAAAWLQLPRAARAAQGDSLHTLLQVIDERQRSAGDFRAAVHMEQRARGKSPVVYEALVYRRGQDDRSLLLITAPKAAQGQGYLWTGELLWCYDPSTGQWDRKARRDAIGATGSRCSDFEATRYAADFSARDGGQTKLGAYSAQRIQLRARPEVNAAFPLTTLWVDRDSNNVLKRQEHATSGQLLRTTYYPRWRRLFSESKNADVWYPEDLRLYDEVALDHVTNVRIRGVDLRPLDASLFTKAWLASNSR